MFIPTDPIVKRMVTAIFDAERYNHTTPEAVLCKILNTVSENARLNGVIKPKSVELEFYQK
jgi:hypothetical protein